MKLTLLRRIFDSGEGDSVDASVHETIVAINAQRMIWLAAIVVLVHLAHVAIFWPYVPGAVETSAVWRNGVILVHAAMLAVIVISTPVVLILRRRKGAARSAMSALIAAIALWYLLGGATLAIVDQLVTPSISPLMITTIGVAMVFVLRPIVAGVNYALVLLVFLVGVGWTQPNPDLVLTNQVNSISAVGLGFGLSFLRWRGQVQAIRQQRRIEEQQLELEAKNRELTLLASRDVLTGLLNRAQFVRDASREVARIRRTGEEACLIVFDVDNFKLVNDTYGHPAGDAILKGIASILSRALRETDLRSRFGGEEFAVLLIGSSLANSVNVAERLRAEIAAETILLDGQQVRVTASFGVAQLSVGSADPLEECYRAADAALYQAKNDGRNCVRWAPAEGESPMPTSGRHGAPELPR